jgi:hypothetical protein
VITQHLIVDADTVFTVLKTTGGITNNKFANEYLFYSFAAVTGD